MGTSERFIFSGDTVAKEMLRGGVARSKMTYQKSSLRNLYVSSSGSSNGAERYSAKLEGGNEKLKIFSWVDEEVSELVRHKIKAWLKPPKRRAETDATQREEAAIGNGNGYGGSMPVEKMSEVYSKPEEPQVSPREVQIYKSMPALRDIKGGRWFLRLFLGIFLMIGLGMLILGVSKIMTAKDSETWPSKEGTVLESKISINSSDDGTTYGADVTYEYKVNEKTYEGDKVTVSEVSTGSRGRARNIVNRYPVGNKVTVFYDPDDPETSVLETGMTGGSWLFPGIGVVFFLIPLTILITSEKASRKENKQINKHSPKAIQSRYGKME